MNTQPEALRLADSLDAWNGKLMMPPGWREHTSDELRRLHDVELHSKQLERGFDKQAEEIKRLKAENAELEAILKRLETVAPRVVQATRAAIVRAESTLKTE